MWSSHAIQLEGCGGPRFQLNVLSNRRNENLSEADLRNFCDIVPTLDLREAQLFCNRDEWQDVKSEMWEDACRALERCTQLTSFDFYAPFCRPGYQDTKLRTLLCHTPQLQQLGIHDGLYSYTETFLTMSHHLKVLRHLRFKNVSFRENPSRECCQSLTNLIRSLPHLERFELSNVRFKSVDDWKIIETALEECEELEELTVYRLTVDGQDLCRSICQNPVFVEKNAVRRYLEGQKLVRPYKVAQRVDATLYVRSQGELQLKHLRSRGLSSSVQAIAMVADRVDYVFHMIRQEIDPSMLIQASA